MKSHDRIYKLIKAQKCIAIITEELKELNKIMLDILVETNKEIRDDKRTEDIS